METEEAFASLFGGRPNAYGSGASGLCVREPVTMQVWRGHLFDNKPIGIYPLRPSLRSSGPTEWLVKWGCADFDTGYESSWQDASRLYASLEAVGLHPWAEITRSKGVHIWLFAEDWVPAAHMRRTLLAAFQVADLRPKEVNPKSEGSENPSFLGNYVRVCYPGALSEQSIVDPRESSPGSGQCRGCGAYVGCIPLAQITPPCEGGRVARQVAFDPVTLQPYCVRCFVAGALEFRAPRDTLARLAKLYRPPAPKRAVAIGEYDGSIDELLDKPGAGLVRWRVHNGPWEGQDRSSYLYCLALACQESGVLDATEARAIIEHVDSTVTHKYVDRPDAQRRYDDIVENAFG